MPEQKPKPLEPAYHEVPGEGLCCVYCGFRNGGGHDYGCRTIVPEGEPHP